MNEVGVTDRDGHRASFLAAAGHRILYAGLAAGLGLPHECGTGTCGSCKMTLLSGAVSPLWPKAPGARVCRAGNELLTCQTAALGPVELATRAPVRVGVPACRTVLGKLLKRRLLTDTVASFSVALDQPMTYLPGQFVTLAGLGAVGPRAYSMTRHAPLDPQLEFLISRNPRGGFTPRLFDHWGAGQPVEVFGPLGRSTLRPDDDRPFLAIAGGSGIAGLLGIIDHALRTGYFGRHPSRLFFGLRDAASGYLLSELTERAERAQGGLRVTVAFSDGDVPDGLAARHPGLTLTSGLVHEVARTEIAANGPVSNRIYFVAGPPAMVNAAIGMLVVEQKVSPTEIRYDRFG